MSRFLEDDQEGFEVVPVDEPAATRAAPIDGPASATSALDPTPDAEVDEFFDEEPVAENFGADPQVDDYHADEYLEEPEPAKRRGSWLKSGLAVLISLGVLLGGGYFLVTKVMDGVIGFTAVDDYPGPGDEEIVIDIPAGATLTEMAEILTDSGVVASARAFLNAANDTPGSSSIQPGSYLMKTRMSGTQAVAALMDRANQLTDRVTIVEGLRNSVVVEQLSTQTGIPVADFEAALADPAALGLPDWAEGATEGFLFPETYEHDATPTAEEILGQMVQQFNQVIAELDFVAKAEALGVDPFDALIIASIIEKEIQDPAHGPDVAQVIYNRLDDDMMLQMDSTVMYANNSSGTVTTTDEERASSSPYNTYVHTGLPPGPISNPGANSLSAAVNPTTGDYLYFVATNPLTGETRFADTWQEHEANVAIFQKWCRDNPKECSGG
ncbi:MAG: endolytic transglycosylase MltG [Brooklawnia sp.]|jgi:UPF0755 protein